MEISWAPPPALCGVMQTRAKNIQVKRHVCRLQHSVLRLSIPILLRNERDSQLLSKVYYKKSLSPEVFLLFHFIIY